MRRFLSSLAPVLCLGLMLTLGACGTLPHAETPTGRPDVTIRAKPETIKAYLIERISAKGAVLVQETPSTLVFEAPTQNAGAIIMMGTSHQSQPTERYSYTIVKQGNMTRVMANLSIIANQGTAFEKRMDFNRTHEAVAVQASLERMKANLEGKAK